MSRSAPLFSIVIPVYNDWLSLNQCLQSLTQQPRALIFETIVVDDGSNEPAPEFIRHWIGTCPLTLMRQDHCGTSAARNRGIKASKGEVLMFLDADSRLLTNSLLALASTISNSPQHCCFQLHLIGDVSSGQAGRAEELRLRVLQEYLLEPDGRIRYLNTAGFAIRRAQVNVDNGLFNSSVFRGEDSVLLASLMQSAQLPLFVPDALVQHVAPLSLVRSLRKDLRSAFLEASAHRLIASMGTKIRLTHRQRFQMLRIMWIAAKDPSIGRTAWFVVVARRLVRLVMLAIANWKLKRRNETLDA